MDTIVSIIIIIATIMLVSWFMLVAWLIMHIIETHEKIYNKAVSLYQEQLDVAHEHIAHLSDRLDLIIRMLEHPILSLPPQDPSPAASFPASEPKVKRGRPSNEVRARRASLAGLSTIPFNRDEPNDD